MTGDKMLLVCNIDSNITSFKLMYVTLIQKTLVDTGLTILLSKLLI